MWLLFRSFKNHSPVMVMLLLRDNDEEEEEEEEELLAISVVVLVVVVVVVVPVPLLFVALPADELTLHAAGYASPPTCRTL